MTIGLDKQQRRIIKVLSGIVLIVCVISAMIFFNRSHFAKKGQFIISEMDKNAVIGQPEKIAKECMYQEAKVSNEYIIYLCAAPTFKDNILNIYFTSHASNKGLIKIKVLDANDIVIGESGLINPNSYLKDIILNKQLSNKEKITIRVMHYEKDTYYSLGEIKLDLFVRKEV